jgi:hypothetical protein
MPSAPSAFGVTPIATALEPRSTVVRVGASGTVAAMNELDATESVLSPKPFVATAVQLYVLELVRELTVIGELEALFDCVVPPSLDVHVTV